MTRLYDDVKWHVAILAIRIADVIDTNAPVRGEPLPVELMNTRYADRGDVHDALADADQLTAWLGAIAGRAEIADLTGAGLVADRTALAEFRAVRDALRGLAAQVTGDLRPVTALATADVTESSAVVSRASGLAPSWRVLEWRPGHGPEVQTRTAGPAVIAVLSRIADEGAALFGAAKRAELRACQAPGCVLYFVRDHPRREWCCAGCGNRARVARHYHRHHGTGRA
jgi:predicted RNA-binding Zn ribbon-like protein